MKKLALLIAILGIVFVGCATKKDSLLPLPTSQQPLKTEKQVSENELAWQAFQKGNYEEAVQQYNIYIQANPQDSEALLYRGRAYMQLGDYEQALQDVSQVQNVSGKLYQARALLALNKNDEARKALDITLADPQFAKLSAYEMFTAYYMDGQLKNTAGQFDQAMKPLENAIQIFDRNAREFAQIGSPYLGRFAYYHRAVAFHMLGRNQQAASDMERYIDLSQKAGAELTSKDYKSLVLAYYLSEDLIKCKKNVPNLSEEDRQDLSQRFNNDSVFSK